MDSLAAISAIPILLALASLVLAPRIIKVVVPTFMWLQLGVISGITWPVLSNSQALLRLTPEFAVDRLGALFMLLSCGVAASCLSHAAYYFKADPHNTDEMHLRVFYACSSLYLLAMIVVFACDSLGVMWIAVELTTLTSAPLVYFDRTKNAVEATWKYLIICSVGIAFALLGTIFLFASSMQANGTGSLSISELMAGAGQLNFELARLGVIFCLLGYGTKAGIFPLHNWLPDAHSEAPAPASAMLSGGLLNCALFAIWRVTQILSSSQHTGLVTEMVIVMGAVTALAASLMLLRQHSFKRMWAYSSIENVGIMLVAIGMGSGFIFFLQALNHSVAKVALFLVTGNIVQACGTKRLKRLHGLLETAPVWSILLFIGTLAVTGTPPFGMFVSEVALLCAAANEIYWWVAALLFLAISISFVAVCTHVGRIICGGAKSGFKSANQVSSSLMPGLLLLVSFLLGVLVGPQMWIYLK